MSGNGFLVRVRHDISKFDISICRNCDISMYRTSIFRYIENTGTTFQYIERYCKISKLRYSVDRSRYCDITKVLYFDISELRHFGMLKIRYFVRSNFQISTYRFAYFDMLSIRYPTLMWAREHVNRSWAAMGSWWGSSKLCSTASCCRSTPTSRRSASRQLPSIPRFR